MANGMLLKQMISGIVEAGCDEAGRGPLAGSVFAAAVIFDEEKTNWESLAELNDSKQLTEQQRYRLRPLIEREALSWAVVDVTPEEIDRLNILWASVTGMQRALDRLAVRPQHILVDGNKWRPYVPEGELLAIQTDTVVKGDGKYMAIAAASVLAKTYRDDYMRRLDLEYPQYGWAHNMGYPTAEHYRALRQFGPTPYHRKSFRLGIEKTF